MNVLWGFLITAGATAVAVTVMLLVRRRAPEGSWFQDGDRASGVFGVLATGFSVLLGFIIFLAFTSYDQSRSGAETEALVLTQQFETAQFFPAAVRGELTGELICYGRSVVYDEWDADGGGDTGRCAQSVGGGAVPRRVQGVEPPTRDASSPPTTSGSSRRRSGRRRASTASTARSA